MKKITLIFYVFFVVLSACSTKTEEANKEQRQDETTSKYRNPVLPGDFADPSVVRVGNDYYATATSSEWAPIYPILHSTNLVNWEIIGHVFPENPPEWADAHFWAPEITYENGKFYVYYTAKKKNGPLCTGVASAEKAAGPYTDHGALVCQDIGAIDGFAIRDENNELYFIWKEDGNSQGKPTPIWGQQMNEERTELIGEKFELFRNDPNTWEGGLVEGAYLLHRGDYFYAFYSGDKCCGRKCTYGVGVARAKSLRGPWEKYDKNPLIKQNEDWKCAGHGSLVTDTEGNDYFLYHAYATDGHVYTGRQGLLDRIEWGDDQWPRFVEGAPSDTAEIQYEVEAHDLNVSDDFDKNELAMTWQWPVVQDPEYTLSGKGITLKGLSENIGAVLAQRTLTADYTATVTVDRNSLTPDTRAGLTAIGDTKKAVGIAVENDKVVLWQAKANQTNELAQAQLPEGGSVQLRLTARDGHQLEFAWKTGEGEWNVLNEQPVDAAYLPPWDRAVRVGLTVKGAAGSEGTFQKFRMEPL